jgi:hypothetical protein
MESLDLTSQPGFPLKSRLDSKRIACVYGLALCVFLIAAAAPASSQDEPRKAPPDKAKAQEPEGPVKLPQPAEPKEVERAIDGMFKAYDLKPHPLPPVPDDPPPHEGAMIGYPIVIEPPDLVLVEVLEAFPGRPISGERLIRPDGTIDLGFYGDVQVAGLTPRQAKVKILKHLRKYLMDEVLGLVEMVPEEETAKPAAPKPGGGRGKPANRQENGHPQGDRECPRAIATGYRVSPVQQDKPRNSVHGRRRSGEQVLLLAQQEEAKHEAQGVNPIPLEPGGRITITIEIQPREKESGTTVEAKGFRPGKLVRPEDSDRVFVDITAHNSQRYWIQGYVAARGQLPLQATRPYLMPSTTRGD